MEVNGRNNQASITALMSSFGRAFHAENEEHPVFGDFLAKELITIAFLLLDPLYLSVLCGFFGGGDMNGIALLCPEWAARCLFGALLLVNGLVFWKRVLPVYRQSFSGR